MIIRIKSSWWTSKGSHGGSILHVFSICPSIHTERHLWHRKPKTLTFRQFGNIFFPNSYLVIHLVDYDSGPQPFGHQGSTGKVFSVDWGGMVSCAASLPQMGLHLFSRHVVVACRYLVPVHGPEVGDPWIMRYNEALFSNPLYILGFFCWAVLPICFNKAFPNLTHFSCTEIDTPRE